MKIHFFQGFMTQLNMNMIIESKWIVNLNSGTESQALNSFEYFNFTNYIALTSRNNNLVVPILKMIQ